MGLVPTVRVRARTFPVIDQTSFYIRIYFSPSSLSLPSSAASSDCFRCFLLRLRSSNVLQVFTSDLQRCFTREEAAASACPTETHIRFRETQQLLLYRKD